MMMMMQRQSNHENGSLGVKVEKEEQNETRIVFMTIRSVILRSLSHTLPKKLPGNREDAITYLTLCLPHSHSIPDSLSAVSCLLL